MSAETKKRSKVEPDRHRGTRHTDDTKDTVRDAGHPGEIPEGSFKLTRGEDRETREGSEESWNRNRGTRHNMAGIYAFDDGLSLDQCEVELRDSKCAQRTTRIFRV